MSGKNITDNLDIYNEPVEGPARQKILDLAQKITDRIGKVQPGDPEYYGLDYYTWTSIWISWAWITIVTRTSS